jgi:hypothetical protein
MKADLGKWRNRRHGGDYEGHRRAVRGAVCCGELAASTFMFRPIDAAGSSETSVNVYHKTMSRIPEHCSLRSYVG